MAKRKRPEDQIQKLPEYGELISIMQDETASIVSDYVRQYVGIIAGRGATISGQPAIYLNQDRVQRYQTYQELAFFDLYAEVERDPHVHAVMSSAKINVAGMKWDVSPFIAEDGKKPASRDQEIANFVKDVLKGTGHLPQHLYNLMGALGMGFSVSEIIYTDKSTWSSDGIRIKKILNRPQRRFQFDAIDRSLKLRKIEDPYYGTPLPENKFIVHRCSSQWENPFGDALDQSIYWMWLFKKTVIKFWMQNLQVGASSVPIVKHPASASAPLKAEALEIAKMIRNGAYGRLPDNFEIIWAEAKNGLQNSEAYERFFRTCNDEISKCINGQTLTAEASSGTGTGSRALGDVHQVTQNARDIFRAEGLSATLNASVVKWIVDYNFASVDGYPEFRFDLEDEKDLVSESSLVKNLTDAGYDFDVTELSEKFNYTISKKEAPKPLEIKPIAQEPVKSIVDPAMAKEFAELSHKMELLRANRQPEINITTPPVSVHIDPSTFNVHPPAVTVNLPEQHFKPVIHQAPISFHVDMPKTSGVFKLKRDKDGKMSAIERE